MRLSAFVIIIPYGHSTNIRRFRGGFFLWSLKTSFCLQLLIDAACPPRMQSKWAGWYFQMPWHLLILAFIYVYKANGF